MSPIRTIDLSKHRSTDGGNLPTMSPVNDYPHTLIRPGTPTPLSPANLFAASLRPRSAWGPYSTTSRPGAEDSLRRLALRAHPSQQKNRHDIHRQGWQVLIEDDESDDSIPAAQELLNNPTSLATDTGHFDASSPPPVSASTRGEPVNNGSTSPLAQQPSPTVLLPEVSPPMPPINTNSRGWDNSIVPEAGASKSSAVSTADTRTVGIACQIAQICAYLLHMFQDLAEYQKFLSYRNEEAQRLLNFLQTLLDYSPVEEPFRILFVQALLRLSRKSELYPQCFTLTDVKREGEYPITDGHFGEIYKGLFRGRVVCLKVVKMYKTSDQAHLYKAFFREAVLWGQLSHPNVLPFYGIYRLGDARNRIGLVSPWMRNGNINEFLERNAGANRPLLISDVAAGLRYLHDNGVVHGDLKCANILVSDSERACLADFGLSTITDSRSLKTRELSSNAPEGGTVRFQAPELTHASISSPRSKASDVYAFAMVCYQVFTGDYPFPELKDFNVIINVWAGKRPSRPYGRLYLDRGLTDHMWELMEDCWTQDPENRLHANQIVARLPRQPNEDQRRHGGWGDLSPSRFRASDEYSRLDQHDVSVAEMLRVL